MKHESPPTPETSAPVDSDQQCTCDPEDTGPTGHMAGCPKLRRTPPTIDWTDCRDDKPAKGARVLIALDDLRVLFAHRADFAGVWYDDAGRLVTRPVTHWAPTPMAPRVEARK